MQNTHALQTHRRELNTLAWVGFFGALLMLAFVFIYFYFMRARQTAQAAGVKLSVAK